MERVVLAMLLAACAVLPPLATPTLQIGEPRVANNAMPAEAAQALALQSRQAARKRAAAWSVDAPDAVRRMVDAVLTHGDTQPRPFIVIDKQAASLFVIDAEGGLLGRTAVLLGSAIGDDSVPGIGERPIALIQPFERTTPAGRFMAAAGRNSHGEDIVWVDYQAAISMHRVRVVDPREHRLRRLASATPDDNRISYGCINVPTEFFDRTIAPIFERGSHAVYVLPETRAIDSMLSLFDEKYALEKPLAQH